MSQPAETAQSAKEPRELNFWLPVHVAGREYREALAEVAGLITDGMDPDKAAELVGIDIQGEKLPTLALYVPSPETIAAGCLESNRPGMNASVAGETFCRRRTPASRQ